MMINGFWNIWKKVTQSRGATLVYNDDFDADNESYNSHDTLS